MVILAGTARGRAGGAAATETGRPTLASLDIIAMISWRKAKAAAASRTTTTTATARTRLQAKSGLGSMTAGSRAGAPRVGGRITRSGGAGAAPPPSNQRWGQPAPPP